MLIARKNRQVHSIQHIGNGRLCVLCKAHLRIFLHLVRIGEGRAIQRGDADFLCIGVVLHIRLAVIDVRKGQSVSTKSIEPCYKAAGIHHTLNGFHILAVGKERAAVLAVHGKQMHEPVGAVKDQIAAVKVSHVP